MANQEQIALYPSSATEPDESQRGRLIAYVLIAAGILISSQIIFLGLIFFMVRSQFAYEERALELPLPSASEARPLVTEPSELFVDVDKDGKYALNGRDMSLNELETALRQNQTSSPVPQTVVIRADRRVTFDPVVAALNLCVKTDSPYRLATADDE